MAVHEKCHDFFDCFATKTRFHSISIPILHPYPLSCCVLCVVMKSQLYYVIESIVTSRMKLECVLPPKSVWIFLKRLSSYQIGGIHQQLRYIPPIIFFIFLVINVTGYKITVGIHTRTNQSNPLSCELVVLVPICIHYFARWFYSMKCSYFYFSRMHTILTYYHDLKIIYSMKNR